MHGRPGSGKQYVMLRDLVANYDDAAKLCKDIGGMLPEPRNSRENHYLNRYVVRTG